MNNSSTAAVNVELQIFLEPSFIFWIVVGTLNTLTSACNIYILLVWKSMQKDTLLLTVVMFAMELCGGFMQMVLGTYHLVYSITAKPESRPMFSCWLMVGWDLLFISMVGIIYLELSFDRFYAAIFPIMYQNRSRYYLIVHLSIAWTVALFIFFFSLLAITLEDNIEVPLCLLRYTLGTLYFSLFSYSMLGLSMLSIIMYSVTALILKCQIRLILKRGGSIVEVKRRMNSKVAKALALSAFTHLLTFTTAAIGTSLVTYFLPYNGGTYGPFFKTFYHFGGITCLPIYCIFQRQFRMGFYHLLSCGFSCKCVTNNEVNAIVSTNSPNN